MRVRMPVGCLTDAGMTSASMFAPCVRKVYEEKVADAKANKTALPPPFQIPTRSAEDKYLWTDVLKIAQEIVNDESVSFYGTESTFGRKMDRKEKTGKEKHVTLLQRSTSFDNEPSEEISLRHHITEKFSDLEKVVAETADKKNVEDHKRHVETVELLRGMSISLQQGNSNAPTQKQSWDNSGRQNNNNFGMRRPNLQDCYYCLGPHYQNDCETRREHILSGIIKVIDGKLCMFDGHHIPGEPRNKSKALRAQEYYAGRHSGKLPPSVKEVHLQSNFYEEDEDPDYDPRADEILTLKVEAQQLRQQLMQSQGGFNGQMSNNSGPPPQNMHQGSWDPRVGQYAVTRANQEQSGDQDFP